MPKVVDENGTTVLECPYTETGEAQCRSRAAQHPGWRVVMDPGHGSTAAPTGASGGMYGPETKGLRNAATKGRRGPLRIKGSR